MHALGSEEKKKERNGSEGNRQQKPYSSQFRVLGLPPPHRTADIGLRLSNQNPFPLRGPDPALFQCHSPPPRVPQTHTRTQVARTSAARTRFRKRSPGLLAIDAGQAYGGEGYSPPHIPPKAKRRKSTIGFCPFLSYISFAKVRVFPVQDRQSKKKYIYIYIIERAACHCVPYILQYNIILYYMMFNEYLSMIIICIYIHNRIT